MWIKQFYFFGCVEVSGAEIYRVSEPGLTLESLRRSTPGRFPNCQ